MADQSAIFVDDTTGDIVAVVLRDFLQSHFISIKSWGVDLVHESINRRSLSQRNGPGQLARVGVGCLDRIVLDEVHKLMMDVNFQPKSDEL